MGPWSAPGKVVNCRGLQDDLCGRWPRVAMCWSQLAPMNLLQGTAEPISKAGGACVKMHLRKTTKGKRVRNSPVNAKGREGGEEMFQVLE